MASTTSTMPEFLTAREAAEVLRIRPWSVYAKARSGELQAFTIGATRTMRFRRDDVLSLLRPKFPTLALR